MAFYYFRWHALDDMHNCHILEIQVTTEQTLENFAMLGHTNSHTSEVMPVGASNITVKQKVLL